MKELQSIGHIINKHYPMRQNHRRKRWRTAMTRGVNPLQVQQNSCVEASYHQVLKAIKSLYMQPGEVFYKRDLKEVSDDWLGMHSFISSGFYWRLDCAFYYDYEIEFAFYNCQYEAEIRKMLRAYPLDRQTKEKQLQPDFKTFYEGVLKVQPSGFIYSLKR